MGAMVAQWGERPMVIVQGSGPLGKRSLLRGSSSVWCSWASKARGRERGARGVGGPIMALRPSRSRWRAGPPAGQPHGTASGTRAQRWREFLSGGHQVPPRLFSAASKSSSAVTFLDLNHEIGLVEFDARLVALTGVREQIRTERA